LYVFNNAQQHPSTTFVTSALHSYSTGLDFSIPCMMVSSSPVPRFQSPSIPHSLLLHASETTSTMTC